MNKWWVILAKTDFPQWVGSRRTEMLVWSRSGVVGRDKIGTLKNNKEGVLVVSVPLNKTDRRLRFSDLNQVLTFMPRGSDVRCWAHYGGKRSDLVLKSDNWQETWFKKTFDEDLPARLRDMAPYSKGQQTNPWEPALITGLAYGSLYCLPDGCVTAAEKFQKLLDTPHDSKLCAEVFAALDSAWKLFVESTGTSAPTTATETVFTALVDSIHNLQNVLSPIQSDAEKLCNNLDDVNENIVKDIFNDYFTPVASSYMSRVENDFQDELTKLGEVIIEDDAAALIAELKQVVDIARKRCMSPSQEELLSQLLNVSKIGEKILSVLRRKRNGLIPAGGEGK